MDSRYIISCLESNVHAKKIFKGVFGTSELLPPPNVGRRSCYVMNWTEGRKSHWFCAFSWNESHVYVFDSASMISRSRAKRIFGRMYPVLILLNDNLQSPSSVTCGYHVLLFIHYCITRGNPFSYYDAMTTSNYEENDRLVVDMTKRAYSLSF